VLASSSPYRRELLARLRLQFDTKTPGIDETARHGESASATALRLAQAKARAVGGEFPRALVIGCDQVVEFDGACLGKPGSHDNAVAQLKAMRGKIVLDPYGVLDGRAVREAGLEYHMLGRSADI